MKSEIISICIPTYNQTIFLKKTLKSIIIQVGVNFEVIITDDSTTEDVKSLIDEFKERYPKVNFIYFRNNPSLGSPENWNYAIKHSNGSYIKIMHHDEWFISETALLTFLENCVDSNTLVVCSSKLINKTKESTIVASESFIQSVKQDPRRLIIANRFGSPSAVFFHRDQIQSFDNKLIWLVDVEFYIRMLFKDVKLNYINLPLYCSIMDEHNITNKCLYNTELQLEEYSYLYNKFLKNSTIKEKLFYLNEIYKILLHTKPKLKCFLYLRLVKRTLFSINNKLK